MTPDEFDEIIGWLEVRWTNLRWTSVTVAALFEDLKGHDAVDVWGAVHSLYEKGTDFAPSPSVIVSKTIEERRFNAERERLAMPVALDAGRMTWPEYAQQTYGEEISIWEAAERLHGTLPDCTAKKCEVHS